MKRFVIASFAFACTLLALHAKCLADTPVCTTSLQYIAPNAFRIKSGSTVIPAGQVTIVTQSATYEASTPAETGAADPKFLRTYSVRYELPPEVQLAGVRYAQFTPNGDDCEPVVYAPTPERIKALNENAGVVANEPSFPLTASIAGSAPPNPICAKANREAVATDPVPPQLNGIALQRYQTGTMSGEVSVVIRLDTTGAITSSTVTQSSGFSALDAAAVTAATTSLYTPRIVECKPVASEYVFRASFPPF